MPDDKKKAVIPLMEAGGAARTAMSVCYIKLVDANPECALHIMITKTIILGRSDLVDIYRICTNQNRTQNDRLVARPIMSPAHSRACVALYE